MFMIRMITKTILISMVIIMRTIISITMIIMIMRTENRNNGCNSFS